MFGMQLWATVSAVRVLRLRKMRQKGDIPKKLFLTADILALIWNSERAYKNT